MWWPLSLLMSMKQVPAEAEPVPKECRICWRGDEDGEDWVAPCHCSCAIVWVHRSCIHWRLKHTPIREDKLRCAVCKYVYKKRLRLKSLHEWFDGWRREWFALYCDLYGLYCILLALGTFRIRAIYLKLDPWWLGALALYFNLSTYILGAVLQAFLHIREAYRQPQRFGLAFYKRFLAVAVRDWVLDAPPPALPR